jgi:hypothetical protein
MNTFIFKGRTYQTGGNILWAEQFTNYHTAPSALKITLTTYSYSILRTTVTGPGILSFWWADSKSYGWVPGAYPTILLIDNVEYFSNYGWDWYNDTYRWEQRIVDDIPAGTHIIEWRVQSNSYTGYSYIDDVVFTPT